MLKIWSALLLRITISLYRKTTEELLKKTKRLEMSRTQKCTGYFFLDFYLKCFKLMTEGEVR